MPDRSRWGHIQAMDLDPPPREPSEARDGPPRGLLAPLVGQAQRLVDDLTRLSLLSTEAREAGDPVLAGLYADAVSDRARELARVRDQLARFGYL